MEERNLGEEFRKIVKGENFITPEIIGFRTLGSSLIVEISKGKFLGDTVYGATIVNTDTKEQCYDIGFCSIMAFSELEQRLDTLNLEHV